VREEIKSFKFVFFIWQTCHTLLTQSLADIYILVTVIIIPCCTMTIIHLIIFINALSSTRRVAAAANTSERQAYSQIIFSDREKSLLKHIIVMMIVYVIGWIPLYICRILFGINFTTTFLFEILAALPIISCLLNIINILIYHHEFRQYIRQKISRSIKRNGRWVNFTTKV
jgi:hypothetical protein